MNNSIKEELVKSLEDSIRGEGEDIIASAEDIERDRQYYFNLMIESYREERRRSALARSRASEIYLD